MKNKRLITVVVIILVYLVGAFIYGKASGEKEELDGGGRRGVDGRHRDRVLR